jgi:FkbM family methyltransferase
MKDSMITMTFKDQLIIWFKKRFRKFYYLFNEGKIVHINKPEILKGLRWIESVRFGLAYSKGYYEPSLLKSLQSNLNEDSVFFDIGGHAGYISLFASKLCKQVYCFEPEPANFKFLQHIMTLNEVNNVGSFNIGVGKEKGFAKFKKGITSSMGRISNDGELEVQIISIDEFCNQYEIKNMSAVKIDVEGFGAEVLRGMKDSIPKFKPVIFFELHNDDEMQELKNLSKIGYTFCNIDNVPVDLDHLPNQFAIAIPKQ